MASAPYPIPASWMFRGLFPNLPALSLRAGMMKGWALLVIVIALLNSACVMQGDPVVVRPDVSDLIGEYRLVSSKPTFGVRKPKSGNRITLTADRLFETDAPEVAGCAWIPHGNGTWNLKLSRGEIDFGSREIWMIQFHPKASQAFTAYCLGNKPPYRLMFTSPVEGVVFVPNLIFERVK